MSALSDADRLVAEAQRIAEQWEHGKYGDQTLRLRAEYTAGIIRQLLSALQQAQAPAWCETCRDTHRPHEPHVGEQAQAQPEIETLTAYVVREQKRIGRGRTAVDCAARNVLNDIQKILAAASPRERGEQAAALPWQPRLTEIVLRCVKCRQHSSVNEVWFRTTNTGACHCGGSFHVAHIPPPPARAEQE